MAQATLGAMGMPSAMERGAREFGDLFVLNVQESVTHMGYAIRGGIDELGTPRPKADPLDVLPSVIYDVMRRCHGLDAFPAEGAPITEVSREITRKTTARGVLFGILDEFLTDASYARMTGRGLNVDGRVLWSFAATDKAMDHIEELFEKALPRPWTTPDKERLALAERVRILEARLRAAVGHGTEKPLPDHVAAAWPEPVSA